MKVKTREKHITIYCFLLIITYIFVFPFSILEELIVLLDKIIYFVMRIRWKIIYKIMEFLFERGGYNE